MSTLYRPTVSDRGCPKCKGKRKGRLRFPADRKVKSATCPECGERVTRKELRRKSRCWWGSFRHPVSDTLVRVGLRTADRKAAEILLKEHERRAARKFDGTISKYEKHQKRPLAQHIDEWEAGLVATGNTECNVELKARRVRKLVKACGFVYWPDVSASRVQLYIGELRDKGRSAQTRNHYLQAVKQLCRWMVADRRAPENPLAALKRENVKVDPRHERRALTPDELRRLIDTARNGPEIDGMSGEERATVYTLAVETGLRRGELRTLAWGVVNLDGGIVTVKAAHSKHRQEDTVPLRPSTIATLRRWRDYLGKVRRGDPVFPNLTGWSNMAEIIKTDLQAARAVWIAESQTDAERGEREASDYLAYRDHEGRFADFHALRHSFGTNLARAGVPVKTAMDLMRHSDVNLTMRLYSHTVLADRVKALGGLPDLSASDDAACCTRAG